MGRWIGKCGKCGGTCTKLKVMEPEELTKEEAVARSMMGIVSVRKMALQCKECGHIQIVRINRTSGRRRRA